jgi:hypothetical protein
MSIDEVLGSARTPMGADLAAGLDTLSYDQKITFVPYARVVLPYDGYVFWIRTSLLSRGALLNAMQLNEVQLNELGDGEVSLESFEVPGSLHYSSESVQEESTNQTRNRVVFSSQLPVVDLNEINNGILYIATFDGPELGDIQGLAGTTQIKFAFSTRGSYYKQTNLWHYVGHAVYPTMASQIVDDPLFFQALEPIVSNSLPIWLSLNQFRPDWPVPVPLPRITFYPSFLVPDNLEPPYISVHIDYEDTESHQAMPVLGADSSSSQLMQDNVRLVLYGCNNKVAQDIYYALLQHSLDTQLWGVCNMPAIQDEKEGQSEFNTLAQKKRIVFEASYSQEAVRDLARQLITSCIPTVIVGDEILQTP